MASRHTSTLSHECRTLYLNWILKNDCIEREVEKERADLLAETTYRLLCKMHHTVDL